MAEVWPDADLLDTFAAALRARPGISADVEIRTAHPGKYHEFTEAIAFFGTEHEEMVASLSGDDFDHFELYGSVYVRRDGVTEDVAKAARDRVKELYAEIVAELVSDRTIGGLLMNARMHTSKFHQDTIPDQRFAELSFTIECWSDPS